jgi:hypothetical protein
VPPRDVRAENVEAVAPHRRPLAPGALRDRPPSCSGNRLLAARCLGSSSSSI